MTKYTVKQKLVGANIKGGVLQPGRVIERVDLQHYSDEAFKKLVDDGWLDEVKDGKVQKK